MGNDMSKSHEEFESSKGMIRSCVSNIYDLQKLRIASGNRLVQSFYQQLGVKPSESPENVDKEQQKLIQQLKKEYSRLSDAVSENKWTVKKAIKELSGSEEGLAYINSDIHYKMVDAYMLLIKSEEESVKVLDKFVKEHPMWDKFFADIKGCGTLMAGNVLAYLDPYKARHVSSFFKYCGLDTVQDEDKDGNKLFRACKEDGTVTQKKVRKKYLYMTEDGEQYSGVVKKTEEFDSEGNMLFMGEDGYVTCVDAMTPDGEEIYEDIETGEEFVGEVVASLHGRRMGDTEMFEYVGKDGNTKIKRGITYNPVLKTKLMGVLTGCLLKAKDPKYSTIYYDYKNRLDNSGRDYTAGHKNMMAQRYMIKQFLRDLWTTWRTIEGLEVDEPYEVAKLGHKPHKYNEYQTEMARKSVGR